VSPRTAAQFAQLKDKRHEQILDAALVVFARRGLDATRVSDLAAAAGMSQGLLYRYFPSKEAVFSALVERALEGARRLTDAALQHPGTPWERLEALCEAMLKALSERPDYHALTVQAAAPSAPAEAHAALVTSGAATFTSLVRLLVEGQATGQVAPGDPSEMARAFFALIEGLALDQARQRRGRHPFPRPEVILRLFRNGSNHSEQQGGQL
jgi:AcrR family transcriptional regulator